MMRPKTILSLLEGGDRRSIGHADEVVAAVWRRPELFAELIAGMWSDDPVVRMRAVDAVEKTTRNSHEMLQPYKKELLGLLAETKQQELCWHLAAMVPRLSLNSKERQRAAGCLMGYLEHRSSIVKTFALQGLAELAQQEPSLRVPVIETLRLAVRNGTPAMKARSRKLLLHLKEE
jgi:hypothetical protein